ncbi:MAG: ABC transporter permease [Chloroflexi bacterium]|nr:ABC transporter permease [Chloroflexota bacterium]
MSPTLLRLMWRHIQRRPTQTLLFLIGVMIGVAMMVSIDIANNSARTAFELSTESIVGKATHEISGSSTGFDQSVYTQIRTDIGWRQAAPIVTDFVLAEELDEQPLRLFGIDPFAEAPFRNYVTASGDIDTGASTENADLIALARFLVEPNTVLMGQELAQRYDLSPGDTLTLQYGDERHTVTVIGLLSTEDELTARALQSLLIADISTAQELLEMEGSLTRIDLILDTDNDADRSAQQQIEAILPPGVTLNTAAARRNSVGEMTEAFELNLTALSLLALVVGMFLVYNTVTFSVVQRRPILGIMRSLGVTRRQVFAMIWAEAALLSAIGAALGLGLGIILARFTVDAVTQTVNESFFTVSVRQISVTPWILAKGMVVGVGSALLAAFLPAYEATYTPPTSANRRSDIEQRMLKLVPYVTAFGVAAALLGSLLLTSQNLVINLSGVFSVVIGMALITILATIIMTQIIRPVTSRVGGVVGRMAPRSILRNLSRTSIAITALMLAVSVIVGVTAMVGSFRITVENWLADTLRADIFISQPNNTGSLVSVPVSPDVISEVEAVDGIERVTYVRSVTVQSPEYDQPVLINAVMSDISEGRRTVIAGSDDYETMIQRVLNGEAVLMTEVFANNRDLEWEDGLTLTLLTNEGPRDFPVLGVYQDFSSTQGSIMMGLATYRRYWDDEMISNLAVYVEEGADIDAVVAGVQEQLVGRGLLVRSNRELRRSALEVFDRTFAITSALNLLATIVAFIGILSALMALQIERRREIGVMRANGLTRRQLWKLTLWETGIMGTIAGIVAMPVGLVLSIILIYIINLRSFGWSLTLSLRVEFFLQAFAVAIIAALLAGIYPAWQAGRIQPVEAIRAE